MLDNQLLLAGLYSSFPIRWGFQPEKLVLNRYPPVMESVDFHVPCLIPGGYVQWSPMVKYLVDDGRWGMVIHPYLKSVFSGCNKSLEIPYHPLVISCNYGNINS